MPTEKECKVIKERLKFPRKLTREEINRLAKELSEESRRDGEAEESAYFHGSGKLEGRDGG